MLDRDQRQLFRALYLAYVEGDDMALPAIQDLAREAGIDQLYMLDGLEITLELARRRVRSMPPEIRERWLHVARESIEGGFDDWLRQHPDDWQGMADIYDDESPCNIEVWM